MYFSYSFIALIQSGQNFISNLKSRAQLSIRISASQFSRIPQLEVNIEEEGNRLRSDFNTFLASLLSNLSEKSDQEEMNIMNMKWYASRNDIIVFIPDWVISGLLTLGPGGVHSSDGYRLTLCK